MFRNSFVGSELVEWVVKHTWKGIKTDDEALIYGQSLVDGGAIHHVADKHSFENSGMYYRFRCDDGTTRNRDATRNIAKKAMQMYRRIHGVEGTNLGMCPLM